MNFFNPNSDHFFYTKKEVMISLLLFLLLFVLLFLRATYTGVFHDELISFYFHIQTGQIFSEQAHFDANNHFLNSILSRWSYLIFGPDPLAIRLPNVLAYPFYFFALFQISARLKDTFLRWALLLSLSMCGFIFEYFAMCRGYGLAMMFLSLAIYTLIRSIETKKLMFIILTSILLWLSVFSNMTMLVSSLVMYIFIFFHSLVVDFQIDKKYWSKKFVLLFLTGIPFLYHAYCAIQLREGGLLIYGNLDGIYETTISTLSIHIFGEFNRFIGISIVVMFWLIFTAAIFQLLQKKKWQNFFTTKGIFPFLLLLSVLIIFIMGRFFEINYPEDRVGMNLVFFFLGGYIFTLAFWTEKRPWIKYLSAPALILPILFVTNLNPHAHQNWNGWRHSQRIYETIDKSESNFKFPLIISSRGSQQLTWCYSSLINEGDHGNTHTSGFPAMVADFILKEPKDYDMDINAIYTHYDSIYFDPYLEVTCFRRKQFVEKRLIYTWEIPNVSSVKNEYFNFAHIVSDSLNGKSLYLGLEMTLDAETAPFRSRLVAAVDREEEPTNLYYEFVQLDWLQKTYRGEDNNVLQGALIHEVPEEGESISFYLWNPDTTSFSIRNGKCYLYELIKDD